jgi:methionine-rich copper-binding protein CopC
MTLSPALRPVFLGLAVTALSLGAAHAAELQVVSQSPAKDARTSFPKQIHLTFNQPIKSGAEIQLMDPDGRRIRLDKAVTSGAGVTLTPELTGGPPVLGPYMLTWQAASASGDNGKGDYTFFVQQ